MIAFKCNLNEFVGFQITGIKRKINGTILIKNLDAFFQALPSEGVPVYLDDGKSVWVNKSDIEDLTLGEKVNG